ncbi:MAG: hypothetical protein FJ095_02475 [Deltaproteobacteria bacterium]|nr:hypothetical protein [Deltaproteobacteria bacterium]
MSQATIVSPEVIARLQSEQLRILVLLAELQRVARTRHDERLDQVVGPLVESLRSHMGLVDGVLDALVPEPEPSRVAG